MVQGELTKRVLEVDRFSDRVMRVRLEFGSHIANIISAYAPQVGCEESVKEEFWESQDSVMRKVPQQEKVYVGADLNGHVGKGGGGSGDVVGGHGFGQRNNGGARIVAWAQAFNLGIMNTFFVKKEEHLVTYKSGGRSTQIDY